MVVRLDHVDVEFTVGRGDEHSLIYAQLYVRWGSHLYGQWLTFSTPLPYSSRRVHMILVYR